MKAVFLDYDTVSNGDLDTGALRAAADELLLLDSDDSRTLERLRGADVAMTNHVELSRERLAAVPGLKLIAVAGTGTNHVDLAAARDLGIGVCNVRGYCTASVVQHVWGLVLGLTQHIAAFSQMVAGRGWNQNELLTVLSHPIRELDGGTFGVIGWGELGRATARVAEVFGMRVVIAGRRGENPGPERLELDQLLSVSDVVSLHCPLTESTRGMIGARELALMQPGALLINTARGALVDGHALREALKTGRLGGAGIDVFAPEPPSPDDPLLESGIPNLILTPHVAWAALESRQRCLDEMAANIADYARGGRRSRVV